MGLMQIRRMSELGERQGVFTPWEGAGFLGDHGGSSSAEDAGTWISFSLTLVGLSSTLQGFFSGYLEVSTGSWQWFSAEFQKHRACVHRVERGEHELACGGV